MTSFKTLSVYMYVCTLVILLNMDWCLLLSGTLFIGHLCLMPTIFVRCGIFENKVDKVVERIS